MDAHDYNQPNTNNPLIDDATRWGQYDTYRSFYNGDQWSGKSRPDETRRTFNYSRTLVNKAASYLMSNPPRFQARRRGSRPNASDELPEIEQWLDQVAAFNRLPMLDMDTAIQAGTLGDAAYTIRWDAPARLPRIISVDPSGLSVAFRGDDLRTLLQVEQTYRAHVGELPAKIAAAYYRHQSKATADEVCTVKETWTALTWAISVNGATMGGGPNVFGFIPYVVFPNIRIPGQFWGASDLVDVLDLQRELNARMSVLSAILEVSGNPIAVVEGVENTENLRTGPGELWKLPADAKAYLLDLLASGGVQLHIDFINLVYRTMHDVSEMPRTSFGDSSQQGAKSGVALEIELQPLLQKIARKRLTWTEGLKTRAAMCLDMADLFGVGPGLASSDLLLDLIWPAVLPADRTELIKQESGLVAAQLRSHQGAMKALGEDDPAGEWARIQAEAKTLLALLPPPPASPTPPEAPTHAQ